MLLSTLFIIIIFHGSLLSPEYLIRIVEHNPNVSPEIIEKSTAALRFISGSILIFAIIIIPFHSVSALGKTRQSFIIEFISIIIYLIAWYLFIEKWKWDIVQIWWIEYIYFSSLGIFSCIYLYNYRKKITKHKASNT